MDEHIRAAVEEAVAYLKKMCAEELAAAETFRDLEALTIAISKELSRQIYEQELKARAERASRVETS